MRRLKIFLSSAMTGELDRERSGLTILFQADSTLREFFTLYVIEGHASPQLIEKAYINEVRNADIFILLLDKQLRDAVRTEFSEARNVNSRIFVYLRNRTDQRDRELAEFIGQEAFQFHCGSFNEPADLCTKIKNDILSDLLRSYDETRKTPKESQDYVAISVPRERHGTSLRWFEYDVIKRMAESDPLRDMDSDQLITLAMSRAEETGNLKEALLIYEVILFKDHDNWQAYNNRGQILSEMGYPDDAFFSYRRALDLNPNSHATLYNIGMYYRDRRRFDEAISYYERALEIKPDKTSALGHLVGIYFSLEEYQKALDYAERAYSYEDNEINLSNYCLALSLTGQKDDALSKAEELKGTRYYRITRAYIFYSAGAYSDSVHEIDALFETGDFDYALAIKRIYCLLNLDQIEKAINWIDHIEHDHFIYPFDYNNIAWTLFEKEVDFSYSAELLRKAVTGDPTSLEAWKNLQCVLLKMDQIDEGLDISDRALKYYPDDPGIIQNRAMFLFLSGNIRQGASYAMQEFARIVGGQVSNSEIERMINQSLASTGVKDIESFEKILKAIRMQSKRTEERKKDEE